MLCCYFVLDKSQKNWKSIYYTKFSPSIRDLSGFKGFNYKVCPEVVRISNENDSVFGVRFLWKTVWVSHFVKNKKMFETNKNVRFGSIRSKIIFGFLPNIFSWSKIDIMNWMFKTRKTNYFISFKDGLRSKICHSYSKLIIQVRPLVIEYINETQ